MNYSLLTLVDNQEEALRLSFHMKSKGVDAYSGQAAEYGNNQWGVYVEEEKISTAQQILDSYNNASVQTPPELSSPGNGDNYYYGNTNAGTQSSSSNPYKFSSSSSKSGSSHSWWYYVLGALVIIGVRTCIKMNKSSHSYNQYEINQMYNDLPNVNQDYGYPTVDDGYVDEKREITLEDIKDIVERENNAIMPINPALSFKHASMQGSKVYFDYIMSSLYEVDHKAMKSVKKEIAKEIYDELSNYKSTYGDDVIDQIIKLGVSFNYRLYRDEEKKPFYTLTIPASYLKQFDKS